MSADPLNGLFSDLLAQPNTWVDGLIRDEVGRLRQQRETPLASGCVLTDTGDFFIRVLENVTILLEKFVSGNHIGIYTSVKVEEMENEDGFSDLQELDRLNETHQTLKLISGLLRQAFENNRTFWASNRKAPRAQRAVPNFDPYMRQDPSPMESDHSRNGSTYFAVDADHYQTGYRESEASEFDSPASVDPVQNEIETLCHSLDKRGTGEYYCPHGVNCKKGGMNGGQLLPFHRNCDFKAHLQKHLKLFKCNLRGCTNSKGFARIDQLHRHQQTVNHPYA